ncbi:FtsK/SpoIIIE domain-containing protein [Isoptericola variabilis]|uniref:Cell division protein FtsK/SpoIIIE n=1 Tax=Isoptericola variabilis (strain 225) TaxID=743718 RepID=F6FS50_ISOV2|nr:FtsK/SpoIIIE domain-containing protein [Isoptericola variabilis]AEG45147.1 cell division protein FtsK/SpoIIIE [Isoptericola variabilis 225]
MSEVPGVPVAVPAHVAAPDAVRLTVHPGEDVEVRAGTTVGELREPLAVLLRRPELRRAALEAGGVPLSDGDVVGRRPLLAGGTVRAVPVGAPVAPRRADHERDVAAVRAPWCVTRCSGPGAGEAWPLGPSGPGEAPLVLDGGGVRVQVRPGGRRRARVVVRREPGSRGPVALVRPPGAGGRRRRPGLVRRRWRPGDTLEVGGTAFALHRSGDVVAWLAPEPPADQDASVPGLATLAAAAVPVAGSLLLAATLRQPAYALFSLVGVLALVPHVVGLVRRRRSAGHATARPAPEPPEAAPPEPGRDPAVLLARLVAAHEASDGAWRRALRAAAARRSGPRSAVPADAGTGPHLPDGALAVRGPVDAARAVARAVVLDLAAHGAQVEVTGGGRDAWSWCRWLPAADGPAAGRLVVVDGAGEPAAALVAADAARSRGAAVVLCLPDGVTPPAWCRAVTTVRPDGRVRRVAPDGTDTVEPLVGVTAAWAERAARRLAGLATLRRSLTDLDAPSATDRPASDDVDPADPRLPATVPLLDLLDSAASPGTAWRTTTDWAVPLGVGADGRPVSLDLVADGPHLLVAGTTGAGKSELLQTLVLGLALRRSPGDLALALVDFKGGASFGACADLPHVVGQVTDLEPGLAGRALAGLRAELHRRERLLADHRVSDAADLPAGVLPRLVVVIDEFRALADDLPEFLPGLLRVAAQGRSLGVHLVLATQRPAGAVSSDVRANVSARIALRVVDAADAHDVVETGAAARIPVGLPGRAVLRVGAGAPVALQCAHAGGVPDGGGPVARRAPVWSAPRPPGARTTGALTPAPAGDAGRVADPADVVAELVAAARSAARRLGLAPGPAPWLPPLPDRVVAEDLPPTPLPAGVLPLALGDAPAEQRRVVVGWDPGDGHLAVVGRARSGRSTALLGLAHAALERGWHVHALVPPSAAATFGRLADHPGFGTLAGPDDPRRAARLLRLLSAPGGAPDGTHDGGPDGAPEDPRVLVVVDGVEELRATLAGADRWDPLTTALAAGRAAFALSADGATVGGVASRVGPRLVLLGTDKHADVVLGAPSDLAGTGGPPGRAAWLATDRALVCQAILPGGGAPAGGRPATAPVRVRPLPAVVRARDLGGPPDAAAEVLVGLGGDDAAPVALDVGRGALVVGPRGSGRTTVLRLLVRRLAATGLLGGVVSRDAAPRDEAGAGGAPSADHSGARVRELLARLSTERGGGRVLVVDDLDALSQTSPVECEQLAALAEQGWAVVASATTTGALLAHRGPLAELRGRRTGVVLAPGERGSEEVFGTPLVDAVEPGPPRPGRGALVRAGAVVPLQVALPGEQAGEDPRSPADGSASARGRVDDPARHEQHDHRDRDDQEHDPAEDGPGRPGAEQGDADESLEDLPRDDGRPAAATPGPDAACGGEQRGRDAEEEQDEEDAHGHRAGAAPDQLDDDRTGGDAEEDRLESDGGQDEAQRDRVRRGTAARTLGGGDRGGHRTPGYVRPGVSRHCDQGLTVHAGETSA